MATVEELRGQVSKLEAELQHLLTVKAEKIINMVLKEQHTQLSYLSEYNKELHHLHGRKAVLTMVINGLSKL